MKKNELLILMHLRNNAREKLTGLSKKLKVPASTVFNRLRRCEKNIFKYACLIDFSKLNYNLKVNFSLKTKKKTKLLDFLLKNKNINDIYRTKDKYAFFVQAIFKDITELYQFCEELEPLISKKQEFHVIKELKKEDFLIGLGHKDDKKLLY